MVSIKTAHRQKVGTLRVWAHENQFMGPLADEIAEVVPPVSIFGIAQKVKRWTKGHFSKWWSFRNYIIDNNEMRCLISFAFIHRALSLSSNFWIMN